jgi:hypothetical protein
VWIDSICINQAQTQEAEAEKLQHIPLMGDVYERAVLVTAHIPDPGDAMFANRCVTFLAWSWLASRADSTGITAGTGVVPLALSPEKLPFSLHDPGWQTLAHLVHNPLWGGGWISQETLLGKRWRLLYGDVSMSLGALYAATTLQLA